MQEAEKKAEEERIRMENIIKGNPLMQSVPDKQADFKVKRRFVVVFVLISLPGLRKAQLKADLFFRCFLFIYYFIDFCQTTYLNIYWPDL